MSKHSRLMCDSLKIRIVHVTIVYSTSAASTNRRMTFKRKQCGSHCKHCTRIGSISRIIYSHAHSTYFTNFDHSIETCFLFSYRCDYIPAIATKKAYIVLNRLVIHTNDIIACVYILLNFVTSTLKQ